MKDQRGMLAEKFRQEVMEDDITKKLVVHEGKEMAEIFDIELQKHEATKKLVKQNMAAQKNILQAMTEVSTIHDIKGKGKQVKLRLTMPSLAELKHLRYLVASSMVNK